MQAMLAAARENGVSAAALNAAQRDMTAAAQKQQRTNEDIARFAKAAQDRLASGNLLSPANDSAVSNAERLRLLDVRHPTTVQVVRDVRSRLITEARARLAAEPRAEAAALLDAAESLGGDADLGELRASVASAQQAAADRRRRAEAAAAQDDASAASEISGVRQGRRRLGASRILRDTGRAHRARRVYVERARGPVRCGRDLGNGRCPV